MNSTNQNDRLHALDAVRAFALLAGIVLHATMSFILPVPALDVSQSTTLGVAFYVIHIFRMSAFYLIAGFFGRMVLERRGFKAFAKDRAKRILLPLVGGWIVLAPLTIPIVLWGVSRSVADLPPEIVEQIAPTEPVFPLLHLWFLYYLTFFYVAVLAVRWLLDGIIDRGQRIRALIDKIIGAVIKSYFAPILFALPLAAVLYTSATWPAWFGIPTPDQGLSIKIPATVGYGAAFAVGWLVHRQIDLIYEWRKRWQVHLVLAIGLTVSALAIIGVSPGDLATIAVAMSTGTPIPGPEWIRGVYVACYTLAIWYWTFAIIGIAMRFCSTPNAKIRYLADSSYWLYLAHLPLVMFFQVILARVEIHWSIKFPAILGVAIYLLLVTYRSWVRHTWLGALLNGRRFPRERESSGKSNLPVGDSS